MSNMSYCRFRNTVQDLRDCLDNFWEVESKEEAQARLKLVKVAKAIIEDYESNPSEVDELIYNESDGDEDENN